jgi:hypothetical protein
MNTGKKLIFTAKSTLTQPLLIGRNSTFPLAFARQDAKSKYGLSPLWKERMVQLLDLVTEQQRSVFDKRPKSNGFNFE